MKRPNRIVAATALAVLVAGGALAQSAFDGAVRARKSHMQLYAFNAGALGAMAKGDVPYDAALAAGHAANLVALSSLDLSAYWPAGSAKGEIEGTRALPAIWEDMAGFEGKTEALNAASVALVAAAGTDLAALQAAMGPVGQACGGCHQTYRASE
jgi:cytochrome c556